MSLWITKFVYVIPERNQVHPSNFQLVWNQYFAELQGRWQTPQQLAPIIELKLNTDRSLENNEKLCGDQKYICRF